MLGLELEHLEVGDFVGRPREPDDARASVCPHQLLAKDELVLLVGPELERVSLRGSLE
jgi:hypothetical protein